MVENGMLTLFDIDGTLVEGARCHYMAFVRSVSKFYGVEEDISGINYAGKTDPQILREVLELGNVPGNTIEKNFQECLAYMTQYYLANVHQENVRALKGVKNLLPKLQEENVLLGLTTGNLEPIAYAKLGRAKLAEYFLFGGFGSDSPKRPCLVKKAVERARENFNYKGDKILVIGDTPRDVDAAKQLKLPTLGVATGRYSVNELKKAGAVYALENLADVERVLKIMNSI
ncbi:MAG TPA: HAD family hydrolase [Methanobacteriaceae archaeon]|nr:HAD family hydrolase [Methanobacteriaceae archaeon]